MATLKERQQSYARMLDREFHRVAGDERRSMAEVVADVSRSLGIGQRQLYRYRSGNWPLPATLVPLLCRRFRSRGLIIALENELEDTPVLQLAHDDDYASFARQTVKQVLELHDLLVTTWSRNALSRTSLSEAAVLSEIVIHQHRLLYAALEDKYRRQRAPQTGSHSAKKEETKSGAPQEGKG